MVQFSSQAWNSIDNIYQAILTMPFIQELKAGSLKRQIFQHYMIQDGIYLGEFARVLAIASARAPTSDLQLEFANSVREAIVIERSLHENFFANFGIEPQDALATEPSPTCFNYTNFLLATAYQHSFAVTVAAVLPCFWIYLEVGKQIYQQAKTTANPYQRWIDTYVDADFEAAVDRTIQIADESANQAPARELKLMNRVFYRAAQFEWLFWDSAYRLQQWQIPEQQSTEL